MAILGRFGPPVAVMGVIFVLSAQPDLNSGLGTIDTIGRKLVHMAEYGLLWWLWWRALGFGNPVPAIAVTLLYAVTDEFHQTFVGGRHGSPLDWAIDAAGVTAAVAWRLRLHPRELGPENEPDHGEERDEGGAVADAGGLLVDGVDLANQGGHAQSTNPGSEN